MAKHKRQHFVPQFYLRRFSKDGKSINIWNIARQIKICNANLKNQCYRNYFYGQDSIVEETLSTIEANAAQVLHSIGDTSLPPSPGSEGHQFLIIYILMQHARTLRMADELNELTDNLAKYLARGSKELEGIDLDSVRVGLKEPALSALSTATTCYPLLFDLAYKVLVNKTSLEFVTSDHPVVLYNQLMSFRKDGSNTGFATKGLQIFLPIDPHHMILLYDSNVYSVGTVRRNTVYITRRRDVEKLNLLQFCSASENVYFRDGSLDMATLHEEGKSFRNETISDFAVVQVERSAKGETRELVRSSRVDIKANLSVQFLAIRYSAKRWRAKFRKMQLQPVSVIRNERLMDAYERFQVEVREGRYTPGQFFEFLQD